MTSRLPVGDTLPRWLGRLVWLLVLAGGTWLLAGIGWQLVWSPPSPPLPAPGAPTEVAREIATRQLMGKVAATGGPVAEGDRGFQLLGVIAGSGKTPGFAVLQGNGESKPKVVTEGNEVAAGVRVDRIEGRQVVLSRNGGEIFVKLPETGRRQQPASPSPGHPN